MSDAAAGTEQVRIALTRVCLRSGSVLVPQRARDRIPAEGELLGWDADADEVHELRYQDGRIAGLGPFFAARSLHVNDALLLRPRPDGHLVLAAHARGATARANAAPVRYADAPGSTGHRDERVLGGSERTGSQRSGGDDGRTASREGASETGAPDAEPAPEVRDGASPESLARARRAFAELGFDVTVGRGGTLRIEGGHGRSRVRALVRVLDEGTAPDWSALLQAVRDGPTERLALVGAANDLTALERPARGARATLWSWDGLARAKRATERVPVGPLDLADAFDEGGLHAHGIERFEARIGERLSAQEAFATVATRLAALHAPTVVRVEDLALDDLLGREVAARELERTAEPPLQWTRRVAPGEYALLYDVATGLTRLSTFADGLLRDLPDPVRPRVQGTASDAHLQDAPRGGAHPDDAAREGARRDDDGREVAAPRTKASVGH